MNVSKIRPFLKWPGGKFRLVEQIQRVLPSGKRLIEPFVGGGALFLNTAFEEYLLNDANPDLITLYQILQTEGAPFIEFCRTFFTQKMNNEKTYYRLRHQFNAGVDPRVRSALFLYLNRHGYNGLCRYNLGKKEFNVPFGRYVKPYFPEQEMQSFHEKTKKVIFVCEDFTATLQRAEQGCVVYCDPPYVPLTATANFTAYRAGGFGVEEQNTLAMWSRKLANQGIPVLVSNHHTHFTRKLYQEAQISKFAVQRSISCKASKRTKVWELLALYSGKD